MSAAGLARQLQVPTNRVTEILMPKSSDWSRASRTAAQSTATNRPRRRGLVQWIARAPRSLPVPFSILVKSER